MAAEPAVHGDELKLGDAHAMPRQAPCPVHARTEAPDPRYPVDVGHNAAAESVPDCTASQRTGEEASDGRQAGAPPPPVQVRRRPNRWRAPAAAGLRLTRSPRLWLYPVRAGGFSVDLDRSSDLSSVCTGWLPHQSAHTAGPGRFRSGGAEEEVVAPFGPIQNDKPSPLSTRKEQQISVSQAFLSFIIIS